MAAETAMIAIEVAAALPDRQLVVPVQVPAGTTVAEAVALSGIAERLSCLEVDPDRLGVFGRRRRPEEPVKEGDRVEVYRPLTADPKEIRRQLAELARAKKKG
jgi:hypothetical protein